MTTGTDEFSKTAADLESAMRGRRRLVSYLIEGDGPDWASGQHIPPTPVVFHGTPKVYFLAICRECNKGARPIPMPFPSAEHRARWVSGHSETGHHIDLALEVRP